MNPSVLTQAPHILSRVDLEREATEQRGDEWQQELGAGFRPCLFAIPEGVRLQYLPKGELQVGADDFMDCTSRAPINALAAKFTYADKNNIMPADLKKWGRTHGFANKDGEW